MSKPLVALRNEISRQAYEVPADEAEQILAHPVWGKINKVVRTVKPEVLHDAEDEDETVIVSEDTEPLKLSDRPSPKKKEDK